MITFYGQPKFDAAALGSGATGYELLIRQYRNGQWSLPEDFTTLPPAKFEQLLRQALAALPASITRVSFNLERAHFVDPEFLTMIRAVQAATPVTLTVELTERYDATISNTAIVTAAKAFFDAGIEVCIDDVGSGNNLPGLVEALTPFVAAYKFGLQNLRPYTDDTDLIDRLQFWSERAHSHNKRFDIAGIESLDDIDQFCKLAHCDLIQGYYFGEPVPLNTEAL
ncbi:EAL domain-containing protein [Lacticaseibacillus sp. GG6-2]